MPVRGVTSGRKAGLRYNGIPIVGFIHKGTAEKVKGKRGAILKRLPYFVFNTPQTVEVGDFLHQQEPDLEVITAIPIRFPRALFAHVRGHQATGEEQIQAVLDAWMMRRTRGLLTCKGDGEWVHYHKPDEGDPWPTVRDGYVVGDWDTPGEFIIPEVNIDTGEKKWKIRCSREDCPWRQWAVTDASGEAKQRDRLLCGLGGVLMFKVRGFHKYAGVYALKLSGMATQTIADQLEYIIRGCGQLWDKKFILHWTPIQYYHIKWGDQEFHAPRLSPAEEGESVGAKQAMIDLFGDDVKPADYSDDNLSPAVVAFPPGLVAEGELEEDLLDLELGAENGEGDYEPPPFFPDPDIDEDVPPKGG